MQGVSYGGSTPSVYNSYITVNGIKYSSLQHIRVLEALTHYINQHPDVNPKRDIQYVTWKLNKRSDEANQTLNELHPDEKLAYLVDSMVKGFSADATRTTLTAVDPNQLAIDTMLKQVPQKAQPAIIAEVSVPTAAAVEPVHAVSVLGYKNPHSLASAEWTGKTGFRTYVHLDSLKRANIDESSDGTYRWDVSIDSNRNTRGAVTTIIRPRFIRAVNIMNTSIPNLNSAQGNLGEVSVSMRELGMQGYQTTDIVEHFVAATKVSGDRVELDFKSRSNRIHFSDPLTDLRSITLSFKNPIDDINYGMDKIRCTSVVTTAGVTTQFQYSGTDNNFTNISGGETVRIVGYKTANEAENATITDDVNSASGHTVVSVVGGIITVNVDTSALTGAPGGIHDMNPDSQIFLLNLTKQIIIRLELEHVEIANDNAQ